VNLLNERSRQLKMTRDAYLKSILRGFIVLLGEPEESQLRKLYLSLDEVLGGSLRHAVERLDWCEKQFTFGEQK
jgi:hypothetical protein